MRSWADHAIPIRGATGQKQVQAPFRAQRRKQQAFTQGLLSNPHPQAGPFMGQAWAKAFFSSTVHGAEGELLQSGKRSPSGRSSFGKTKENGGRVPHPAPWRGTPVPPTAERPLMGPDGNRSLSQGRFSAYPDCPAPARSAGPGEIECRRGIPPKAPG